MFKKRFFWVVGFIMLWFMWPLAAGYSAVYTVTSSEEFTQALQEAAQNGEDDTIVLQSGTFDGSFSFNSEDNKSLAIQATSPDGTLIKGPLFIQGADSTNLKITNVSLTCQNNAWSCLEVVGFSKVTIDGVKVESAQANYVMRIMSNNEVKITNSEFKNNNVVFSIIYSVSPKTTVTDSIFKNNKIELFGVLASQFLDKSWEFDIERNNFINNSSLHYGSSVYVNGKGYVNFTDNLVYGSKTIGGWSSGGALFIQGADIDIINNDFQGNETIHFGGSVFITGEKNEVILKSNKFANDKAFDGLSVCLVNTDFTDSNNLYNNLVENKNLLLILLSGIYNYVDNGTSTLKNNDSPTLAANNYSRDDQDNNNNCEENYNEGYEQGYNNGYSEGYNKGYIDGKNDGYNDGYQAAIEFCRKNPASCGIMIYGYYTSRDNENSNILEANQDSETSLSLESWNSLSPDQVSISQWLYYDSKSGLMTYNCYLTAKEDISGPIVLILKTDKKIRNDLPQGAEIKGYTEDGYPYFEIISSREILKAGERSWTVKIYFDLSDEELQYWRSLDKKDIPFEIEIRNMPSSEASDIDITNNLRIVRYFKYDSKADLFYMTFFVEPPKERLVGPIYAVFMDKDWPWEVPSVSSYTPAQPDGYTSQGYPYIEIVPYGKIFDAKTQRYRIYFRISSKKSLADLWSSIRNYKWFNFWKTWDKRRDSVCLDKIDKQLCINLPTIVIKTEIN